MKKSIEWHEENLRNMKITCENYLAEKEKLLHRIENLQTKITYLDSQIKRARFAHKSEFDRNVYKGYYEEEAIL